MPSLILRPIQAADLPEFFAHATDPEAIRRALPLRPTPDWPAFCERWARILEDPGMHARTAVWQGRVTGYLAVFEQAGRPSVAYWFGRAYWGQGLARQALALLLAEVPERPLFARVAVGNPASLRVLVVNGFRPVGADCYHSAALGQEVEEIVLRLDIDRPAEMPDGRG